MDFAEARDIFMQQAQTPSFTMGYPTSEQIFVPQGLPPTMAKLGDELAESGMAITMSRANHETLSKEMSSAYAEGVKNGKLLLKAIGVLCQHGVHVRLGKETLGGSSEPQPVYIASPVSFAYPEKRQEDPNNPLFDIEMRKKMLAMLSDIDQPRKISGLDVKTSDDEPADHPEVRFTESYFTAKSIDGGEVGLLKGAGILNTDLKCNVEKLEQYAGALSTEAAAVLLKINKGRG